jgi:nucleotide-binding universal stress UspA family protein
VGRGPESARQVNASAFPAGLEDLNLFVSALFRHADDDSYISLRAFDQHDRGVPPISIEGVRISEGTASIVAKAARASTRAANRASPGVFAPPVATFNNSSKAGESDVANGVAISVEIDVGDPLKARKTLEHILGPVTIAMHSGSEWLDPETGEIHPKTHLHWRLSEPTRTAEEHAQLKRARWAAAVLVGADMTAVPPCHPLRWPGSWNLKAAPRRAQICAGNEASEVHLVDALEKLEEAVEGSGLKLDTAIHNPGKDPQARIEQVRSALSRIPNTSCAEWHEWNRMGMIVWRATGGSTDGLNAWSDWCAKDGGTDDGCLERWNALSTSPPSKLGFGSLVYMAMQNQKLADTVPPRDIEDDGYYASLEAQAALSAQTWSDMVQREGGHAIPASPEAKRAAGNKVLWRVNQGWNEVDIAPRPWIVKGYLLRGSVTVVSGPGSAGKSSLMVAWATALALGCNFNHFKPLAPQRVGTYNVEDDADEQRRRFSAIARQMGLPTSTIMENLTILGPETIGTLLKMTADGRLLVNTPVMDAIEEWLDECPQDVLILDPFVELHGEEENDNTAVRAVMARFRTMAASRKMAIVLLHHSRKGAATPGDPDSLRGASAIVGAARVALTLNVMTEQEADAAGVQKSGRRDYFRLDGAKSNYAPIEEAEWFERRVKELDNGDIVAHAWPWKPPSVWKEMLPGDIEAVLDRIASGPSPGVLYAPSNRGGAGPRWAGTPVMQIMNLTEAQALQIIDVWLKNGLLVETTYRDSANRKDRTGVTVDRSKQP